MVGNSGNGFGGFGDGDFFEDLIHYHYGNSGYAQHVEWDLNKTLKTLTETLTALFIMA